MNNYSNKSNTIFIAIDFVLVHVIIVVVVVAAVVVVLTVIAIVSSFLEL